MSRNGASLEEQNKFNVPKDRKTIKLWYERGLPCHRFSPIYTRIGFRVRNLLTGDFNTFCIDFDYLKLTRDLLEIIKTITVIRTDQIEEFLSWCVKQKPTKSLSTNSLCELFF